MACWGDNQYGQSAIPVQVNGVEQQSRSSVGVFMALSANHTCVVRADGKLYCWGRQDVSMVPDKRGEGILKVAVSVQSTCIVDLMNKVDCWGKLMDD